MHRVPYILTVDPSLRNFGWAIIQLVGEPEVVRVGVIRTKKDKDAKYLSQDDHRCCQEITSELETLIALYKPCLITAEARQGSQSSRAAVTMAMAWAALSAVSQTYNIPVLPVQPKQLKKKVALSSKATKEEVANAVIGRFYELEDDGLIECVKPKSKREHVYDAIGAFIAAEHIYSEKIKKMQEEPDNLDHEKMPKCPKCGRILIKCKCTDNDLEK